MLNILSEYAQSPWCWIEAKSPFTKPSQYEAGPQTCLPIIKFACLNWLACISITLFVWRGKDEASPWISRTVRINLPVHWPQMSQPTLSIASKKMSRLRDVKNCKPVSIRAKLDASSFLCESVITSLFRGESKLKWSPAQRKWHICEVPIETQWIILSPWKSPWRGQKEYSLCVKKSTKMKHSWASIQPKINSPPFRAVERRIKWFVFAGLHRLLVSYRIELSAYIGNDLGCC